MKFSVVVPSYNASETIRACLDALMRQETDFPYEVILVNSSDDETPAIVRDEFPDVKLVQLANQTFAGTARNLGATEARAELLAFTDADCVPHRNWLAALNDAFAAYECNCAVGAMDGVPGENWIAKLDRVLQFTSVLPSGPAMWISGSMGGTANLGVTNETYEAVGGFREVRWGEDVIFTTTLNRRFGSVRFVPEAVVGHVSPTRWDALISRAYTMGTRFPISRLAEPTLPWAFATNTPVLAPLLAAAMATRIVTRLAQYDRALLLQVLAHTPAFIRCLAAWTRGMIEEIRRLRREGAEEPRHVLTGRVVE